MDDCESFHWANSPRRPRKRLPVVNVGPSTLVFQSECNNKAREWSLSKKISAQILSVLIKERDQLSPELLLHFEVWIA